MLCTLCLQCMLMLSMCIYVCLLPFGSGRRLELIPGRCLPQKVYVRACTSTLAPEQRFIPRHHPLAALAAQSARGFQAPTPFIPLRTSASCSSCSSDKPAFINHLRRSRYTQVFAVLHHGVFTKSHLLGRLDVRIARSSPGDAIRIPHVCGKLASVHRVAIQDPEPIACSDCHQRR